MKKYVALFLIAVTLLTLAACGSKDALAGTWSADLGDDGVITWTFNGKGKCTMENAYMKQDGTYTIDGDQLTVSLKKAMSAGSGVYVPPQAAEGWKTPCALKKAMPVLHPQ